MRKFNKKKLACLPALFGKKKSCMEEQKDEEEKSTPNSEIETKIKESDIDIEGGNDILKNLKEDTQFRSKSYMSSVKMSSFIEQKKSSGDKKKTETESKKDKKECDEECEDLANKVEIGFMIVFTLVFVIYCFIMFGEKPSYSLEEL